MRCAIGRRAGARRCFRACPIWLPDGTRFGPPGEPVSAEARANRVVRGLRLRLAQAVHAPSAPCPWYLRELDRARPGTLQCRMRTYPAMWAEGSPRYLALVRRPASRLRCDHRPRWKPGGEFNDRRHLPRFALPDRVGLRGGQSVVGHQPGVTSARFDWVGLGRWPTVQPPAGGCAKCRRTRLASAPRSLECRGLDVRRSTDPLLRRHSLLGPDGLLLCLAAAVPAWADSPEIRRAFQRARSRRSGITDEGWRAHR